MSEMAVKNGLGGNGRFFGGKRTFYGMLNSAMVPIGSQKPKNAARLVPGQTTKQAAIAENASPKPPANSSQNAVAPSSACDHRADGPENLIPSGAKSNHAAWRLNREGSNRNHGCFPYDFR